MGARVCTEYINKDRVSRYEKFKDQGDGGAARGQKSLKNLIIFRLCMKAHSKFQCPLLIQICALYMILEVFGAQKPKAKYSGD